MRALGDDYEQRAVCFLQAHHLRIIARNFSAKTGEIDIIAQHNKLLSFIEVRARSNPCFDSAAASVDQRKQQRIINTAQLFLQQHPRWADMPCRFDVIAFTLPKAGSALQMRWIRAAFTT